MISFKKYLQTINTSLGRAAISMAASAIWALLARPDSDGIANCLDDCDNRIDSDGDGTPDCTDNCENDPNKTEPGDCGCGVADTDTDGDGVLDCNDLEIDSPCPLDVDADGISNDDDEKIENEGEII